VRNTRPSERSRREAIRSRRARARSLGDVFPAVSQVGVRLRFASQAGSAPSGQSHLVYPSAPATFEYPCPHGDCGGGFDLTALASGLMRESGAELKGVLPCDGTRPEAGLARRPCGLEAHFRLDVSYVD